jgi:hypothetical protein
MTQHPVHDAVAALLRRDTLRVEVTPTLAYTARAACLLRQLADSIGVGMESGGRGIPGSRPPIAVDAHDLWWEIAYSTSEWAAALDVDRRPYLRPAVRDAAATTPPVGRLLRAVAAQAVSTGREPIADRIARNADRWARQIRSMLHDQVEQRGVRGATCAECGAAHIVEERDGENYRLPAIALITHEQDDGVLRWLTCRACGWYGAVAEDGAALTWSSEESDVTARVA